MRISKIILTVGSVDVVSQTMLAGGSSGRIHPHSHLENSKLVHLQLYNTIERKPDTGTIRQSETVLQQSAVQRLYCLTAQTTMPRAEITGNASLSERGRNSKMVTERDGWLTVYLQTN